MKCIGTVSGPCPDNNTGTGVKKSQDGKFRCDQCRQNSPSSEDNTAAQTKNEYICNELLCYIQNNVSTMDADDLASVCQNFYHDGEVTAAFELLRNVRDELKSQDSNPNKEVSLRTIIQTLKTTSSQVLPKLVAADLSRIPTASPDKIDVVSLFKDMNMMRNRLDNLCRRTALEVNAVKNDVRILYSRTEASQGANSPRPSESA